MADSRARRMTAVTPRWWLLSDVDLLALLRRAAAGEDPALLLLEEYANSEHENVE